MISTARTFRNFLRTPAVALMCEPGVYARLLQADDFKSIDAIERWARDRYSTKDYTGTVRPMLHQLWDAYLKWVES